jgi:two-component system CheB/CheR fusion protein
MNEIDFPVIGIGASAGGLKALQVFFDNVPADSGLGFVVITHLAPQKTSAMDELLAAHSAMEVQQISSKTKVQPNHIYVIPPNNRPSVLFFQVPEATAHSV